MTVRRSKAWLLATVVGTAVVAAGGWMVLVAPQRAEADALRAELALRQDELARRLRATAQPAATDAVLETSLRQLTTALPDRTDLATVLRDVDRLARANGLAFQSATPSPETAGPGLRALPLAVTLQGRFASVSRFIRDLQSGVQVRNGQVVARGQVYSVTDLVLGAPGDGSFPGLEATVTVTAHAFDPTPVPAAAGPAPAPIADDTVAAGMTP